MCWSSVIELWAGWCIITVVTHWNSFWTVCHYLVPVPVVTVVTVAVLTLTLAIAPLDITDLLCTRASRSC